MKIWLKIRIQRAKITMGTIFGPFISILSQKNILGQIMKNCRIFFDTLCMLKLVESGNSAYRSGNPVFLEV